MTMQALARSERELGRRIDSFLKCDARGVEADELIRRLSTVGKVGIFGGMVRDIARSGSEAFASDIDLVVDGDAEALAAAFLDYRAERNRFGGYRLSGRHVKFDVWTLKDTWAIKEGLVGATGLDDLTKTTFFDWDAAVYIPADRLLHCSVDYFDRIHSGVVTINLEENPNPLGAIARTLRLLVEWEVGLSQRLTDFLWQQIEAHDVNSLVRAQKYTLGRVPVKGQSIPALHRKLSARDFFEPEFRYQRNRRPWA
jgi:predicted nucleotidyltransferase